MLVVSEYLRKEKIHPDAQKFLDGLRLPTKAYPLDDFSEMDWAPKEDAVFLQRES